VLDDPGRAGAIKNVQETPPDVAAIGLSMSGMGGREVVERLLSPYPKLPVLILPIGTIRN